MKREDLKVGMELTVLKGKCKGHRVILLGDDGSANDTNPLHCWNYTEYDNMYFHVDELLEGYDEKEVSELKKLGLGYVHDTSEKLSKEETLDMFIEFLHEKVLTQGEPQEDDIFQVFHETKIGNLVSEDFEFEVLFENVIRHLKEKGDK